MILAQALQQSARIFSHNGIEDSHLEARVLVQHVLGVSPAQVHTQTEQALSQEQVKTLRGLIDRRLRREPAAYIIGHKEFYGVDYCVDSRVLIPRPETELLVEKGLEYGRSRADYLWSLKRPVLIADVGTGCGAIAISLALNLPQSRVYAMDISFSALEVARLNCEHHCVSEQIRLLQGDLLEPLPEPVDLIVANLPYIRNSALANLSPEITDFEPRLAIDGGPSGLSQIRRLLQQVEERICPGGCLLFEIAHKQDQGVTSLINRYLRKARPEFMPDLSGVKRVVRVGF